MFANAVSIFHNITRSLISSHSVLLSYLRPTSSSDQSRKSFAAALKVHRAFCQRAASPMDPLNPHLSFGYCCLNTRLQKKKIICSRTCRLDTLRANGPEFAQELALQNLRDVLPHLEWNEANNIKVFRLSSDIFPLQAHVDVAYPMDFAQELLTEIGNVARKYGHRLTLHPGQYHVLTAKTEKVLENTISGLEQQCEVLDRMGMDKQSIMVIHGGGVYGNKPEALERLEKNMLALKQNVRDRLVLENDEMAYNIEDLLPISQKLKIPIVVDFHHDSIYPSSKPVEFYLPAVYQVWDERGIKPKVHVSQSPPDIDMNNKMARRAHGDYIDVLPDALLSATRDIDVMFEAKMKEDAVLRYRERYGQGSPKAEPLDALALPQVVVEEKPKKSRPKKFSESTAETSNPAVVVLPKMSKKASGRKDVPVPEVVQSLPAVVRADTSGEVAKKTKKSRNAKNAVESDTDADRISTLKRDEVPPAPVPVPDDGPLTRSAKRKRVV